MELLNLSQFKGDVGMKLKFDSNLDYQTEAVKAVTDLFDGQSSMMSYFSINGQTGFD